jgi:hypothetical protein
MTKWTHRCFMWVEAGTKQDQAEEVLGDGFFTVPLGSNGSDITHYGCNAALTEAMYQAIVAANIPTLQIVEGDLSTPGVGFNVAIAEVGLARINNQDE